MRKSDIGEGPNTIVSDLIDDGIQGLTNSEVSTIIHRVIHSTIDLVLLWLFQDKRDELMRTK